MTFTSTPRHPLPDTLLPWLRLNLGNSVHLTDSTLLYGSTSATLYQLSIKHDASIDHFVLRLYNNAEWLAIEPDIVEHEASALRWLSRLPLPTPELVAVDISGTHLGIPAILMTKLPGKVDLQPSDMKTWLSRQAEFLVQLHSTPPPDFLWTYRPYYNTEALQPPTWSARQEIWRRAIELIQAPPPPSETCFVHRDFHPVNILWQAGELSGVVDWVNACLGAPNIDIAWNRMNLNYLYGENVANQFLTAYQAQIGTRFIHQPYWDIIVLLETLPGPPAVYPPWRTFSRIHLSPSLLQTRLESFLSSIISSA